MIPRVFARGRIQPKRFAVRTATRLSYAKGADTPPLSNETLPSFYEKELLAKFSTRPALISRHEPGGDSGYLRWSYEELWKRANDLARGLLGLGARKGTRVGVVMGNNRYEIHTMHERPLDRHVLRNSAYVQLQWACSIIGAILVTINPAYKVHELVNRLLASKVPILKPGIADGDVEPRWSFTLVPGSEYPILKVSKSVGRSVPGDRQFPEG